jgi:hypothetical protein
MWIINKQPINKNKKTRREDGFKRKDFFYSITTEYPSVRRFSATLCAYS